VTRTDHRLPACPPACLTDELTGGLTTHVLSCPQGIAVGIATKIPPHNLGEVVAALEALVKQPDISARELLAFTPAPDFPTGARTCTPHEALCCWWAG
jgi:hypothetical protein